MTLIRNRKGFSLIELMIVIAIIGILVAVALPQFAAMTEDAKKTKAKQDCDTICQAIQKYNSLEGSQVEQLMDLKGKYLTNIDTLKDPWGNSYQIDVIAGAVYSKGPDGQDNKNDLADKKNADNIKVPYIGALTIVKAQLEVNPAGESSPDQAFDVLHLFFNKRVMMANGALDIIAQSEPTGPSEVVQTNKSADPSTLSFRWCEGTKNKYVAATDIFKSFDQAGAATALTSCSVNYGGFNDGPSGWQGIATAGTIFHSEDSREIIIAFPAGTSGSIIPGTHFINLTCNKKNTNPVVGNPTIKEWTAAGPSTVGGEMSGTPVKIEVYE